MKRAASRRRAARSQEARCAGAAVEEGCGARGELEKRGNGRLVCERDSCVLALRRRKPHHSHIHIHAYTKLEKGGKMHKEQGTCT